MRKFVYLVFGCLAFLSAGTVSFASDGDPTTKVAIDFDVSDIDYSVISYDVVSLDFVSHDKFGPTSVIDVGKYSETAYEVTRSNEFGIASHYNFTFYGKTTWLRFNEWLIYKHELEFKSFTSDTYKSGAILSYSYRC